MKEELDTAEIEQFCTDLSQLLSQKPGNIQWTNRQLADFPEFLKRANRKFEEVLAFKRKEEAAQKAREEEKAKADARARAEAEERERQAQIKEEQFLLDSSANSSVSNASRDPVDDFGRMQIGSNNETSDEIQPVVSNEPCVDFSSFIQEDGAYLMLKKEQWPPKLQNDLKNELVSYPLGVAYDETLKLWLVCDRNTDKVVLLNVRMETVQVCEAIKGPTAIMVYEEGMSVAVLCADGQYQKIYIYNHSSTEPFIQPFATHEDPKYNMKNQMRGLAKSTAGNILSLEKYRIRVFNNKLGGKAFEMKGSGNPCFIATYRSTVAVSDLGVNKVFIFNLDDKNWDAITFNKLQVIETEPDLPLDKLANMNGFRFVAGMQFDINGYLLIGDARGHSIKLYDTEYNFLHRVSSDFLLPYVSSFYVNKDGECILLNVKKSKETLVWVKMTSIPQILQWVAPPASEEQSYQRFDKSRRGGFQKRF